MLRAAASSSLACCRVELPQPPTRIFLDRSLLPHFSQPPHSFSPTTHRLYTSAHNNHPVHLALSTGCYSGHHSFVRPALSSLLVDAPGRPALVRLARFPPRFAVHTYNFIIYLASSRGSPYLFCFCFFFFLPHGYPSSQPGLSSTIPESFS